MISKSTLASTPDAVLVDVRTPDEFSEGIIEGAINIDFKDPSFDEKINALDKSNHILSTVFRVNAAAKQQNRWIQSVLRAFICSTVVIKIGRMRDWRQRVPETYFLSAEQMPPLRELCKL
jgi:rhodanese-related sulfurtransferase